MNAAERPIAIIGGGWAGLSAAIELTLAGRPVTLFEAAPQLGGRARAMPWQGLEIDNGPHLILGAYRETLRLINLLGTRGHLDRRPLRLLGPDLDLRLPRLPAPFHLAVGLTRARGLSWREKWAAARLIRRLQARNWKRVADTTLADWLLREDQPERLIRRLWQPLALAALNTPIALASAQTFAIVLRDSLGGPRAASDALFTRTSLDAVFSEPARHWLIKHAAQIHIGQRIRHLQRGRDGWRLDDHPDAYAQVILATSPIETARLLESLPEGHPTSVLQAKLGQLRWQPIMNLWLHFDGRLNLPYPMQALGEADAPWLIDRQDSAEGLVCLVASAYDPKGPKGPNGPHDPHSQTDPEHLLADWLALIERYCGPLPPLRAHRWVHERRATFAATPDRPRFAAETGLPGLWLAGDYTHPDYPATLEGAVRSGVQCARLLITASV